MIACAVSKTHTTGPYRICVGWGFHFCRGEEFQDNINTHLGEVINTLRTGDADLRFYVTTVQDG